MKWLHIQPIGIIFVYFILILNSAFLSLSVVSFFFVCLCQCLCITLVCFTLTGGSEAQVDPK